MYWKSELGLLRHYLEDKTFKRRYLFLKPLILFTILGQRLIILCYMNIFTVSANPIKRFIKATS